jgi:hypothetical protein
MFSNPLTSNVSPIILSSAKQPFGQIEITLRNLDDGRKIVVQRSIMTNAVQEKNKKLKRVERKNVIL